MWYKDLKSFSSSSSLLVVIIYNQCIKNQSMNGKSGVGLVGCNCMMISMAQPMNQPFVDDSSYLRTLGILQEEATKS